MIKILSLPLVAVIAVLTISCMQKKQSRISPKGYNFREGSKYNMPSDLLEISGIAFNKGNPDTVYAIQDEEGKLFYGDIDPMRIKDTKFGKHGDYEDVAVCGNSVFVLKSNGKIYAFPLGKIKKDEVEDVLEIKDKLPDGEYEGMYADQKKNKLYILCKNCADEKTTQSNTGYVFDILPNDSLKAAGNFKIQVSDITRLTGDDKIKLRPSALAQHPITGDWYVISSVNKLLVVLNKDWKAEAAYSIKGKYFLQPEGLAFDKRGNMYISNEGDEFSKGCILKYKYMGRRK